MSIWRFHPDEDVRRMLFGYRVIVAILILVAFVTVRSCTEIRYTLSGTLTTARVSETLSEGRRGGPPSALIVRYRFQDEAGAPQRGSFRTTPEQWTGSNGDEIEILYLPGTPSVSTPPEKRQRFWLLVLGGLLAIGAIWCVQAYRLARRGILI